MTVRRHLALAVSVVALSSLGMSACASPPESGQAGADSVGYVNDPDGTYQFALDFCPLGSRIAKAIQVEAIADNFSANNSACHYWEGIDAFSLDESLGWAVAVWYDTDGDAAAVAGPPLEPFRDSRSVIVGGDNRERIDVAWSADAGGAYKVLIRSPVGELPDPGRMQDLARSVIDVFHTPGATNYDEAVPVESQ